MTRNLFHLASQNKIRQILVSLRPSTHKRTQISSIHAAESCCTQHHAVKLMGAAAHIDRLPDWQMHKDALQSRLSPLLFCALPFTSCHVEQCAAFRKLFFPFITALLVSQIDYHHWPVLSSQGGVADGDENREGLCLKTGEGATLNKCIFKKKCPLWCSVDQWAGKRVHR